MKSRNIDGLEEALQYKFSRPELLEQATTHTSQARELESLQPPNASRVGDNEQLEFLGDAVLGLITTEELFHRFPNFREGQLSKMRAHLVSQKHLIQVAQRLEVGSYLKLSRGEEKSGGRAKTALLVDSLEAILGAMYIDGGIGPVRQMVIAQILLPELERITHEGTGLRLADYKSALQEKLQAMGHPQPVYVLVKERGPEHNKTFTVEVRLKISEQPAEDEFAARAEGSTKKSAEQAAARQVLEHLETRLADSRVTESKQVRS